MILLLCVGGGGSGSWRGKRYGADGGVAFWGKGGARSRLRYRPWLRLGLGLRIGLQLGFRIL